MDMMAEGQIWLATHPPAQNQAFNINNGDTFRWLEARASAHCAFAVPWWFPQKSCQEVQERAPVCSH